VSLAPRAEYLADLTDLAARCAVCFCAARCAGCDVAAISPAARAAVALGAPVTWLHAISPAYDEDTMYLAECESIRAEIPARRSQVKDLLDQAEYQASEAQREMREALIRLETARYLDALLEWGDARSVISACHDILSALERADRELAWAPVRYFQVYEAPVTFVAQGGLLPYEGRWVTGEVQRPSVRWLG
jgi:hypothetical protein